MLKEDREIVYGERCLCTGNGEWRIGNNACCMGDEVQCMKNDEWCIRNKEWCMGNRIEKVNVESKYLHSLKIILLQP